MDYCEQFGFEESLVTELEVHQPIVLSQDRYLQDGLQRKSVFKVTPATIELTQTSIPKVRIPNPLAAMTLML